jgi:tRNA A-37 threonylcarbamoyl transferase component Bud32
MHKPAESSVSNQLNTASGQKTDMYVAVVDVLLLDGGSALTDLELVRYVPDKRYVYRAQWQGQHVYVKLFVGKNNTYYANRDVTGVRYLMQAEIATPPLLFQGQTQDHRAEVLIFLAIEQAKNAEETWQGCDDKQRFEFAQNLVRILAQHHKAGLIQTDLYFKNFLVQNDVVYTLDGDGIRHLSRLFQKRQRLGNLATLLSKMDVLNDQWIPVLYQHYCQQLNTVYALADESAVHTMTRKIRSRMASAYADKKVFRTCTDVKVSNRFDCFLAVSRDFEKSSVTSQFLDTVLADQKANFKNGNTCTIAKTLIADRPIVIKRYNIKNVWHGLNRAFRVSRAALSWANAHRLIISDIAAPKPLALLEERFGCLRRRAYFLSEYVDAPDALQFFASSPSAEEKKIAASNIATLFLRLYLFGFSHGDCKATNIKIVDLKPLLIDLDAMQAHRFGVGFDWWFERKHIKDIKRLMENWEHDAETTHLLAQALRQEYTSQHINAGDNILIRAGIA